MSSHSKKVQNLNPHLDAWVLSEDSGFLLQSKDIHMGSHRLCLDFYDSSILYWLCLFVKNTHIRIVLHTLLLLLMDANRDQYTLSSQSQDTSSFLYFLSLRTSWDLTLLGIQLIYFLYFPVNIQICLFSVEAFMNSGASAFPHHVTVSQNCSSEESLQILCSRNSSILHCHTGAAELIDLHQNYFICSDSVGVAQVKHFECSEKKSAIMERVYSTTASLHWPESQTSATMLDSWYKVLMSLCCGWFLSNMACAPWSDIFNLINCAGDIV